MADVAPPSGVKNTIQKPEKPDEETYNIALKKAEKEHADTKAKFVSISFRMRLHLPCRNWH